VSVKAGAALTVSVMVAVCVNPPPVPVTVMVDVPAPTVEGTVMVTAEVPEPGAAIDVGLKATVTPEGWPLADSAIAELNPPETFVVMVDEPLLPWTTETEVGEAEMVKAGAALTVRVMVAVCVNPPPVPVTVMVDVPAAVVDGTVMVTADVPEPGAAMDVGLKATVTPEGWPLADSAMAESNPPETAVVMVDDPLLPATTETEVGEAEIVKAGEPEVGASALISPVPLGLPQPVTRS